jgi:DNA-binding GntR family transcriptional regulator
MKMPEPRPRRPASKPPLYEQAYYAIRNGIIEGRFKSGHRVSEGQLCEMLSVSRTPVREAVRRLVSEGMLTSTPHVGLSVFSPSIQDISEIYVIRASLEGLAARLAAEDRSAGFVDRLSEVTERASRALEASDNAAMTALNTEFHGLIIQAAQNMRLANVLQGLPT